jgi:hypothetical protein
MSRLLRSSTLTDIRIPSGRHTQPGTQKDPAAARMFPAADTCTDANKALFTREHDEMREAAEEATSQSTELKLPTCNIISTRDEQTNALHARLH